MKLIRVKCKDDVPRNFRIEFPFHNEEGKPDGKMEVDFVRNVYSLVKNIKISEVSPVLKLSSPDYGQHMIRWDLKRTNSIFEITFDIASWNCSFYTQGKKQWAKYYGRYSTINPQKIVQLIKHWIDKAEQTNSLLKEA